MAAPGTGQLVLMGPVIYRVIYGTLPAIYRAPGKERFTVTSDFCLFLKKFNGQLLARGMISY